MKIYSEILLNKHKINPQFKKHIKDYIKNYDKITPLYIFCLASTYPERKIQIEILKNYLENEGDYFAVKYSDFAGYSNYLSDRLFLFTKLKNKNMIFNFLETDYYKKSIDAIYHFEQNNYNEKVEKAKKYYDTLKSIHDFWTLFFPKEKAADLIKLKKIWMNLKIEN